MESQIGVRINKHPHYNSALEINENFIEVLNSSDNTKNKSYF